MLEVPLHKAIRRVGVSETLSTFVYADEILPRPPSSHGYEMSSYEMVPMLPVAHSPVSTDVLNSAGGTKVGLLNRVFLARLAAVRP